MPNDINKLRRLMRSANYIKKDNPAILKGQKITSSQALKYAWWFESFREQLRTGAYRFSYFKKDGSIREARGTLCMDLIPEEHRPLRGYDTDAALVPVNSFRYYDLIAGGWRSFRLDNFIGFVEKVNA